MSEQKEDGWVDVALKLPPDNRPVWVGIKDTTHGPIVIKARYYADTDDWTVGEDENEMYLRTVVYCWQEIVVPSLPEWMLSDQRNKLPEPPKGVK